MVHCWDEYSNKNKSSGKINIDYNNCLYLLITFSLWYMDVAAANNSVGLI